MNEKLKRDLEVLKWLAVIGGVTCVFASLFIITAVGNFAQSEYLLWSAAHDYRAGYSAGYGEGSTIAQYNLDASYHNGFADCASRGCVCLACATPTPSPETRGIVVLASPSPSPEIQVTGNFTLSSSLNATRLRIYIFDLHNFDCEVSGDKLFCECETVNGTRDALAKVGKEE